LDETWKGRGGGGIEDLDVITHDLDGAGGQVRVLIALGTGTDLAGDLEDVLGAELVGDGLIADDHLDDP
jgi:hypothetical protein